MQPQLLVLVFELRDPVGLRLHLVVRLLSQRKSIEDWAGVTVERAAGARQPSRTAPAAQQRYRHNASQPGP